jgi:flagellar basal body-associated protein FliL
MARSDVDVSIDDDGIEVIRAKKSKKGKKDKKNDNPSRDADEKGGKGLAIAIVMFIAVLLGAFSYVLIFNGFGLRDKYLSGIISRTPFLNTIIQIPSDEEEEVEPPVDVDALYAEIEELSELTAEQNDEIERLRRQNEGLRTELSHYDEFDEMVSQFRRDKEDFDNEVVFGEHSNYADFVRWFEQMNPETAELLYKDAVGMVADDERVRHYMGMMRSMGAKDKAAIFVQLMSTNDNMLVVELLLRHSAADAGEILGQMPVQQAGALMVLMEPYGFVR